MVAVFDFRKMRAYVLAREFYEVVFEHSTDIDWRERGLIDQLLRASSSVCLNIAEGSGEFSRAEKSRFYRIARRSACESLAAVDRLTTNSRKDRTGLIRSAEKLHEVSALLTTMVRTPR
jgi:four helix bundle protein